MTDRVHNFFEKRTLFLLIALVVATIGWFIWHQFTKTNNTNLPNGEVACTMEAKLCPDGSYVGRTGPNCEFTACPVR